MNCPDNRRRDAQKLFSDDPFFLKDAPPQYYDDLKSQIAASQWKMMPLECRLVRITNWISGLLTMPEKRPSPAAPKVLPSGTAIGPLARPCHGTNAIVRPCRGRDEPDHAEGQAGPFPCLIPCPAVGE